MKRKVMANLETLPMFLLIVTAILKDPRTFMLFFKDNGEKWFSQCNSMGFLFSWGSLEVSLNSKQNHDAVFFGSRRFWACMLKGIDNTFMRHNGQFRLDFNHVSMQGRWNPWTQLGRGLRFSFSWNSFRQMEHSAPSKRPPPLLYLHTVIEFITDSSRPTLRSSRRVWSWWVLLIVGAGDLLEVFRLQQYFAMIEKKIARRTAHARKDRIKVAR